MHTIYALVDPLTGDVRYIGRTTLNPRFRLSTHCSIYAASAVRARVRAWVKGMAPLTPCLKILPDPGHIIKSGKRLTVALTLRGGS
jgi:hypothetical protein